MLSNALYSTLGVDWRFKDTAIVSNVKFHVPYESRINITTYLRTLNIYKINYSSAQVNQRVYCNAACLFTLISVTNIKAVNPYAWRFFVFLSDHK